MTKEKLIWTLIFVIGIGALGWRFFTTGMSLTYVAGTNYEFVEVEVKAKDAGAALQLTASAAALSCEDKAKDAEEKAKDAGEAQLLPESDVPETVWVNLADETDPGVESGKDKIISKLTPWTTWRDISMEIMPVQAALKEVGLPPALALDPTTAKQKIVQAKAEGLITQSQEDGLQVLVSGLDRYPEISMSWQRTFGVWVAALLTLAIMSFLYRDNPFYKVAEAVVIGSSAGYVMVAGFWTTFVKNLLVVLFPAEMRDSLVPGLGADTPPDYIYIIPLVMIVLLLWRLAPRGGWISRWPLAFFIGVTAGFRLIGYLEADFLGQISAAVIPLYVPTEVAGGGFSVWLTIWASFSNIVITLSTLTGLVYFFFSVEHTGLVGRTAKVGIWFLMVAFGAMFGFTVMGRIALLSQRLEFLFGNWLDLIPRI